MAYWRLFYHVTWATKEREPILDEPMARTIVRSIQATCRSDRAIFHAFGWMPDHVHLAVSIPPGVAVGTVVGHMKGASSHAVNDEIARASPLRWQGGYGVVSFAEKNLPAVIDYIQHQRERHAADRPWDLFEHVADGANNIEDEE
jgi:putative transposase